MIIDGQDYSPLLVKVEEAARLTGISRRLAYELVASKEWPSIKIGRAYHIPVGALGKWIKEHEEQPETQVVR